MDWDGGLPIDPTRYAARCGVEVEYKDSLAKEGRSGYFDSKSKTIYINPDEPEYRQRFTIAHELGHCLLSHGDRDRLNTTLSEYDPKEADANAFAAQLLMPEMAVREMAARYDLNRMAYFFDVSRMALFIRMKSLGIVK
jgi:Zn-dependent peptidase ImmA (M78 family)